MDPSHLRMITRMSLSALSALTAQAEAPHAAWRTILTAHYRIHYPPSQADWARDVASRIEGIHARVVALVGYENPKPIQVVLVDPMADPNGLAMPLLPNPYAILWATEPRSDDFHGNALSGWTELIVSHEMTHIHHLTRPSRMRTPLGNLFDLPIGPLVLKCPRWVSEGFATLAEGRITGSGRPHSALRAALIRQWARTGALPPYEALNRFQGFQGGSMAYLVGSAYLEWLELQRPGQPDILKNLWKQLASRRNRSFDAAFLATFGFTPQDGYRRFQAEAAHDALEWEIRFKAQGLREGDVVLREAGVLRDLAVSPDGTRLLASLEAQGNSCLRVWRLQPPAAPKRTGRPDPLNDVEDVVAEIPVRAPAASLPTLNHRPPQRAEWVDDATVRFLLKHADATGDQHRRPAVWHLGGGVDRAPSPIPLARWQVLEPVRRDGAWALVLDGVPAALPGPAVGRAFVEEARGFLWAGCEVDGVVQVVRVPFTRTGGAPVFQPAQAMTRTVSGAWNPAPSPDGASLYFTTLDARGMEVRKLDLALPPLQAAPAAEPRLLTTRTVMPPPVEAVSLPRTAPPPSAPYRALDNQWLRIASGAALTPAGNSWQVGLAGNDLLGRFSWQAMAGDGSDGGPSGTMAGFSSAAWAWKPSLTVFTAFERPSLQRFVPAAADRRRRGAELAFTWEDRGDVPFWFSPVAASERVDSERTRTLLGLRAGMRTLRARGPWGIAAEPSLQWFPGTTTGPDTDRWNLLRGDLAVRIENPALPVTLRTSGGRVANSRPGGEAFHLGGPASGLVPASLDCDQVEQPALPAFLARGERFLRWRGEAGGLLRAYLEGTALWNPGEGRPPFLRVAGLEATFENPLGTASEEVLRRFRIQAGLHRPLDGPMRNRTVGTLTLVVRP